MLSHNFLGGVALDALRPGVPVGDDAVEVQHVEGIVRHAFDQKPELALAFAQRLLRGLPLGDVASDLGKSQEIAALASDRVDDYRCPEAASVLADPPALGFEAALARGNFEH